MSIYEYNAKKQRMFDREEGREEGRKEGREEGREERLVEQICKKLNKGMSVSQIAAEVEEDEPRVQAIVSIAEKYAPDYDVEKIVKDMFALCLH